jgi:hypothetical protein
VTFTRASSYETATPGMWFSFLRSALETVKHERHGHVGVVCPLCHKAMTLSRAVHTVTDDGTVHPSLVCRQTGCLFHAFVRLDGW